MDRQTSGLHLHYLLGRGDNIAVVITIVLLTQCSCTQQNEAHIICWHAS